MNAITAVASFSVAALVLAGLLRANLGDRLVAAPSGERWHRRTTPIVGGIGIFAGLSAGAGAALLVGAIEPSAELFGILGGCTIMFAAGLADDVYSLSPLAKIGAQLAAASLVLIAESRIALRTTLRELTAVREN